MPSLVLMLSYLCFITSVSYHTNKLQVYAVSSAIGIYFSKLNTNDFDRYFSQSRHYSEPGHYWLCFCICFAI